MLFPAAQAANVEKSKHINVFFVEFPNVVLAYALKANHLVPTMTAFEYQAREL
jgi:hypothetical protein